MFGTLAPVAREAAAVTPKAIAIISSGRVRRHSRVGYQTDRDGDGQRPPGDVVAEHAFEHSGGHQDGDERPVAPDPSGRAGRPGLVPHRAQDAVHRTIVGRRPARGRGIMRGMDTAALRKAYDDLLADTTRAVLAGEPRPYYNHDAVDTARLSALGDDRASWPSGCAGCAPARTPSAGWPRRGR